MYFVCYLLLVLGKQLAQIWILDKRLIIVTLIGHLYQKNVPLIKDFASKMLKDKSKQSQNVPE